MGLTWTCKAPEIQTMYSLNMPVAKIRAKVRQEFEKHRYVNQLQAVDVLLQLHHAEYQVRNAAQVKMRALLTDIC